MNIRKADLRNAVTHESVRSVSKLLLIAVWVGFVSYLFTLLPGVDRVIPRTPITLVALASAVATTALVGLLVYVAPKLAALVRMGFEGPYLIVENVSSAVYWSVLLAAVLVSHRGFSGLARPLFGESMWLYDVTFLLWALPAVAVIGARLYASVEPSSELVADRIAGSEADEDDLSTNGQTD